MSLSHSERLIFMALAVEKLVLTNTNYKVICPNTCQVRFSVDGLYADEDRIVGINDDGEFCLLYPTGEVSRKFKDDNEFEEWLEPKQVDEEFQKALLKNRPNNVRY